MTAQERTLGEIVTTLESGGFREIDCAPRDPEIRAGRRVRNWGEQYYAALVDGTATVVKVMRRGADETPDSWGREWGRPNVEVIVERDQKRIDRGAARYACWADYGTVAAQGSQA